MDGDYRRLPALKYDDLSPEVRKLLDELRPEEVEGLRLVARLGPDGIKKVIETIKFADSLQTAGRFSRRAFIVIIGTFLGSVVLARQIVEAWQWVKSQFQ